MSLTNYIHRPAWCSAGSQYKRFPLSKGQLAVPHSLPVPTGRNPHGEGETYQAHDVIYMSHNVTILQQVDPFKQVALSGWLAAHYSQTLQETWH